MKMFRFGLLINYLHVISAGFVKERLMDIQCTCIERIYFIVGEHVKSVECFVIHASCG